MKIVYQNVILLLAFIAYNYNSLAKQSEDQKHIPLDVAGFFHENDDQSRLAFKSVIAEDNVMHDEFYYTALDLPVQESDSFETGVQLCNLTQTRILGGVFCPTYRKPASVIESTCRNFDIPVFHIDWRSAPTNYAKEDVALNFYPHTRILYQGLAVIVKHLKWRNVAILYENTGSLVRLQDVLKIQNYDANATYNSVTVRELGPGPDYRATLKQALNRSEHRIIIDCKTKNIMTVLQQAKALGMLQKHFSYFLTSLDAHTLDFSGLQIEANITTVRIMNPESKVFQDVVSRWQNYKNKYHEFSDVELNPYSIKTNAAIMSDAVTMFLEVTRDVKKTNDLTPSHLSCSDQEPHGWTYGLTIAQFLKDHYSTKIHLLTAPMNFDDFGRRKNFNLSVVEGNREKTFAIWNPTSPETLQFLESEEARYKELEQKWSTATVRVASILGEPYLSKKQTNNSEVLEGDDRYEGFSKDLMKRLAKELNITIKFTFDEDNRDRGVMDEKTKTWNGLIRDILDGRAELAICDLTITPERREVVDFSTPFMRLGISILHKKSEPKEGNMYAFLDPLSPGLWMYSATLYLVTTVVLYFIARLSPPDWENPHPCDPEPEELENIWNIKNCLWLTLGSIMNQGCDILPKGICSRMVASMWWFFTIIVTNSYMANLAAFLTNQRSKNTINSAEDLALQTKIKYGTMEGGSTYLFFKNSKYPLFERIWTNMEQSRPSVFEKTNNEGVTRVLNDKNGHYAFFMESSTLEYQVQNNCNLTQVGGWLDSKSYGIAMPLNYPHRSRINEALLTLHEQGVIKQLKEKWWTKTTGDPCPVDVEEDSAKLALGNVGGVFIVLAIGIGLAYIVAITEFLWNVRNVSVEEHISFWEALKIEWKFALNISVTKKKVKRQASQSSRSRSGSVESRGLARSILQGAGSFLRLDVLGRGETPGGSSRHTSRHSSRPLD